MATPSSADAEAGACAWLVCVCLAPSSRDRNLDTISSVIEMLPIRDGEERLTRVARLKLCPGCFGELFVQADLALTSDLSLGCISDPRLICKLVDRKIVRNRSMHSAADRPVLYALAKRKTRHAYRHQQDERLLSPNAKTPFHALKLSGVCVTSIFLTASYLSTSAA